VAFRKGLAETDYFEGCNVAIETHWARNESFRAADLAGELVARGVAVLVASGNAQAVLAAKVATTTIPIVFGLAADPVEIGLDLRACARAVSRTRSRTAYSALSRACRRMAAHVLRLPALP
jgi:ABC-type uncharacterized transport system substrate-binding protein